MCKRRLSQRPARALRALVRAAVFVLGTACGHRQPAELSPATALRLRTDLEEGLDSLGGTLDRLDRAVSLTSNTAESSAAAAVGAFRDARVAYKRIELLLEPYGPSVVEQLNGPVEIDDDHSYRALGEPAGFAHAPPTHIEFARSIGHVGYARYAGRPTPPDPQPRTRRTRVAKA